MIPLRIICAAVISDGGLVLRCHRHSDGLDALRKRKLHAVPNALSGQGFIGSDGHYYTRRAAYLIQRRAGIESHDPDGYHGEQLYSEDLY